MKQIATYLAKNLFTAKQSLIFVFAFLLFTFGLQVHAQTCSPAPVGLVSWWSGDNNALDSRSRNNGTLVNGATFAGGNIGQAFSLDGNDDKFVVPHNANLNVANLTAEAWVFPTAFGGQGSIINKRTVINNAGYGLEPTSGGNVSFFIYIGGNLFFVTSSSQLTLNTWSHVAGTFDGSTLRVFINGVQDGSNSAVGSIDATTGDLVIGENIVNGTNWTGKIDEPAIFNRALSATEIQAIFNAGIAGKCKPTATVAPSGQVGWWSGDGNANDTAGTNNGVLSNGASYIVGKVGQGFRLDGIDDAVSVPVQANNSQNFTVEGWIRRGSSTVVTNNPVVTSPGGVIFAYGFGGYGLFLDGTTNKLGLTRVSISGVLANSLTITDTNWHHVAVTKSGSSVTFYLDGTADTVTYSETFDFNEGAAIGRRGDGGDGNQLFGDVDEISQYSVPLTQDEITSIVNAGIAGKLKDNTTATGANVVVSTKSDATVTFPNVTTAGITQQIPLDLSLFPSLPLGSTATGLNYDIATSAAFTGSPTVCFNLPSVTNSTIFNNLRILHLESSAWTNRTDLASINFATKTICTSGLTSLSPFAVVNGFGPTAASASIRGRVSSAGGRGITNVSMSLTNTTTGEIRYSRSTSFGYFNFKDLEVGNTYILSLSSKRYSFANPTRVISLAEDLTDVDFVALP